MKTIEHVCLQHDRSWPCKRLEAGEREHIWAYRTLWTTYQERRDDY